MNCSLTAITLRTPLVRLCLTSGIFIQHRDLKLDNILTNDTDDGVDVKLVDFGLSAHFEDFRLEHDVVGTWVSNRGLSSWRGPFS